MAFEQLHKAVPRACFVLTFTVSHKWADDVLWTDGGPVSLELDIGLVRVLLERDTDLDSPSL